MVPKYYKMILITFPFDLYYQQDSFNHKIRLIIKIETYIDLSRLLFIKGKLEFLHNILIEFGIFLI